MTKLQQVIYRLLTEVHDICEENGIICFLHPQTALFMQNNRDIPIDISSRCVYMTAEGMQRFIRVFEERKRDGRAIESLVSNPRYPELYSARYVDTDTLFLKMDGESNYVNNGLFVKIEVLRFRSESRVQRKILTILELGWHTNIYPHLGATSKKRLLSKYIVKCTMLIGKENYTQKLYDYAMRSYQTESSQILMKKGPKNVSFPAELFQNRILLPYRGESFWIPEDIEDYQQKYLGKGYCDLLQRQYIQGLNVIENPLLSYEEYLKVFPDVVGIMEAKAKMIPKKTKLQNWLRYRTYCWAMINMAGDKYNLKKYYNRNYVRIVNLYKAGNYDKLMVLFGPYYDAQKKYAKYKRTFSIDKEIDNIYYETLRNRGKDDFAKKMIRMV